MRPGEPVWRWRQTPEPGRTKGTWRPRSSERSLESPPGLRRGRCPAHAVILDFWPPEGSRSVFQALGAPPRRPQDTHTTRLKCRPWASGVQARRGSCPQGPPLCRHCPWVLSSGPASQGPSGCHSSRLLQPRYFTPETWGGFLPEGPFLVQPGPHLPPGEAGLSCGYPGRRPRLARPWLRGWPSAEGQGCGGHQSFCPQTSDCACPLLRKDLLPRKTQSHHHLPCLRRSSLLGLVPLAPTVLFPDSLLSWMRPSRIIQAPTGTSSPACAVSDLEATLIRGHVQPQRAPTLLGPFAVQTDATGSAGYLALLFPS